jgi:type VI secretion system protein ImpH
MGHETDPVSFLAALADAPYRYDFYQALRRLEGLNPGVPRWGMARRPSEEPARLGQDPDLSFAPAPLALFDRTGRVPRRQVRLFGLFGPNGPLPLHVTEYARERLHHAGDATLCRFFDVLQHRLLALFYRAWAQAQPHVQRDRPSQDRFTVYVGSLFGLARPAFRDRDSVSDLAKFFHVGAFVRHVRNAEGLTHILQQYFRVSVEIEERVGHWMLLSPGQRTQLPSQWASLGAGAVLGRQVWDRQHKFRIRLGPLTLAEYESFLPDGKRIKQLVDWVRLYLGLELEWDVRLALKKEQVPAARLGRFTRLGWTTWLGRRRSDAPADDLCLDAEAFVAAGVRAA